MNKDTAPTPRNPVAQAFRLCWPHFAVAALFSAAVNILYLVPTLYMMQVYNRAVPANGVTTLVALSIVGLMGLATLCALDWLRGRLLLRASAQVDAALAEPMLKMVMNRADLSRLNRMEATRGFDMLRHSLSSPGVIALLDTPWAPIYLVVAFLLHPALGALTLASAIVLALLTWANERSIKPTVLRASEMAGRASVRQQHVLDYTAEIRALGLSSALTACQIEERSHASGLNMEAGFKSGSFSAIIKFVRLASQSAALGLGAYLAIEQAISAGAIFAASLILSRALQPVEQVNAAWKSLVEAHRNYRLLSDIFDKAERREHTRLPAPTGAIQLERVTMIAPQSDRIAVADVTLDIKPGEIIGLVGLSGAGKSTLLRALAGSATPARGHVRFDGASAEDWDREELAQHIGYLPQNFILFPGTVKQNISRFQTALGHDPAMVDAATIAAAKAIDAHEMIQRLPDGYDTPIGVGGIGLSAGQTQRIAIARALYRKPKILLLDEPTAHLDVEASHAFVKTLAALRMERTTVLLSTHSNDLLAATDKLLLLRNGRAEMRPLGEVFPTRQPVSYSPVQ